MTQTTTSQNHRSFAPIPQKVWWIAVVSVCLRLLVILVTPMNNPMAYEQIIIPQNVIDGHGFDMAWPYDSHDSTRVREREVDPTPHPSAFMPPFVPFVNTIMFMVFGNGNGGLYGILILQCCIAVLLPILVYRIARRIGSEHGAMIATLCTVLYAPGLITSATPAGAIWYCVTGLIIVDRYQMIHTSTSVVWQLGVALGFMALMRSEFLIIGVVLACIAGIQTSWKTTVRAILMMMIVVAPWLIRNAVEFGQPVGIVSHPWREIWRGANERATGSGYDAAGNDIWEGKLFPHIVDRLDSIPHSATFELQADAVFKDEAQTYIRNNVVEWFTLSAKKVLYLWTIDPYYPKGRNPAYIIPTILTSLLILIGLVMAIRRRRPVLPIVVIMIMMTGLFAITYVLPRYQTYLFSIAMPLIACIPLPANLRWKNLT